MMLGQTAQRSLDFGVIGGETGQPLPKAAGRRVGTAGEALAGDKLGSQLVDQYIMVVDEALDLADKGIRIEDADGIYLN